MVSKLTSSAGLIAALVSNAVLSYDFLYRSAAHLNTSYSQAVSDAVQSASGRYFALSSQTNFYFNRGNVNSDICSVFFSHDTFKNLTSFFIQEGLMQAVNDSWQYVNGVVKYPYLYQHCTRIFEALRHNGILNATTTVHYMYPQHIVPEITNSSALPALSTYGIWYASSIPQAMMVLQILYLLFIAIW